jgi:hypothetical protein
MSGILALQSAFKVHSDPFRIWFLSGKCGPLTQALASGGPFGLPAPGHRDHKPAACMALKVALRSWNDLVNGHFRYLDWFYDVYVILYGLIWSHMVQYILGS